MKVGFIVECGPEGAETKVIPYIAQMVNPAIVPDVVPLDRKPILKEQCGRYVRELLDRGCEKVLIVWDLLPDWGEYDGRGCLHVDRQEIFTSLQNAGIDGGDGRVHLVCIHAMLEAWLLADERALKAYLFPGSHSDRVPRKKNTEDCKDPKAALNSLFKSLPCRISRYTDFTDAIKIAKELPDLRRLERLDSFQRFQESLLR
jgi:hypothetical protein